MELFSIADEERDACLHYELPTGKTVRRHDSRRS